MHNIPTSHHAQTTKINSNSYDPSTIIIMPQSYQMDDSTLRQTNQDLSIECSSNEIDFHKIKSITSTNQMNQIHIHQLQHLQSTQKIKPPSQKNKQEGSEFR